MKVKSRVNISSLIVVAGVFFLTLFGAASFTQAATFTVDSLLDTVDASPGNGVCATAGAVCTLRAAIQETNALVGADTITFSAGVFNPGTINVLSALPNLTDTAGTIIDGGAAVNVIINGGGGNYSGFTLAANSNSNQIKNVTIQNFGQYGITSVGPNNSLLFSNNVIKTNGSVGTVDGMFLITATNSVIDGNTFNNNTNRGFRLAANSNSNTVTNNQIFSNGGVGIGLFSGSSSNTIEGNSIYSNGTTNAVKYGIYLDDNSTINNVIRVNLIRNNGGAGILVGFNPSTTTGTKIYHNTIHSNTGNGITVGSTSTGTILRNNILTSNTAWGINTAVGGAGITISHNDYFGNTSGTCTGTNCPGANIITTDPLYENAAGGNFNLKSGSGAFDTGCDLGLAGDDTACDNAFDGPQPDMNGAGAGNFYGAAPDMGAFESNFASTCPVVSNAADAGPGSLRDCITIANGAPGTTLSFSIPTGYCPGGVCTITLLSALPAITAAGTVIDGSTEQPNQGVNNPSGPEIEVAMNGFAGFSINNVGNVTIRELVINGASGAGVTITGASATLNKIYGNYIGTNATGTAAAANGAQGVSLTTSASNNDIGGPNAGEGNVISGNTTHGIQIGTNANNNRIRGNKIGTNALVTAAIANATQGVQINGVPTSGTVIGGSAAGEANIISGNGNDGIAIAGTGATDVTVYGNTIGTDAGGTVTTIGNGRYGTSCDATAATTNIKIGGLSTGQGNLIAYNVSHGVRCLASAGNAAGNEIKGNTIGNNTGNGIYVGNVTGPVIAKNLVRNNGGASADGIRIAVGATSAKVYHNTMHANAGDGISVEEVGAVIKNNIFTNNGGFGINRVAASMEENYDDVNGNTSGPCGGGCALGANSIITDPLYNADYTLQAGSPAINAGCDLGAAGDDTACDTVNDGAQPDMNGATAGNYNGSAPDMGAYESSVASTCPVVSTTADSGLGSLRDCITFANSNAGADTITFNIAGCPGGICTIVPTSVLPALSDATGGTTIDGYTQSGAAANTVASPGASNAVLNIQLSGGGANFAGLTLSSANNIVKGLVINGFSGVGAGSGITITGASATGNTVSGNYLGANAAGTAAAGNYFGIYIINGAQSNTVGGTTPADRNLMSGNTSEGIEIVGATTSANLVKGNYIGTDKDGIVALANAFDGVGLYAPSNIVGGATAAERNIISGNGGDAVVMGGASGTSNLIKGNWIGVDVNGAARANGQSGVRINISANSNIVGGTSEGEGNTIAYNTVNGLRLASTGNQILGNTIHNNTQIGVNSLADNQTIAMNLIRNNGSGGNYDGIRLAAGSTNAKVYNNTIHANGSAAGSDGISVEDTGAIIRNNIITGHSFGYGINRMAASMTESYNDVTDAATSPANALGRSNVALDATDLNTNPLYVNSAAGDFTLTECTSPAINAGIDLVADQPDLNGASAGLYNGTAPDMGRYETVCGGTVVKRAFTTAGTPIADTSTVAVGTQIKFMLYINHKNGGAGLTDVSIRDTLAANYVYNGAVDSIKVVNPAGSCALLDCTAAEESTMFGLADAAGALTNAISGVDTAGLTAGPPQIIDIGDQNVANAQLNVAANSRLVVLFTVQVQ